MARFGVFTNAGQNPIQQFEADYMQQEGAIVSFFNKSKDERVLDEQVGAANLDKNQYVRKLT
jgi:hypothetical protein